MKEWIKKYWRIIALVLFVAAAAYWFYSVQTSRGSGKKTTEAIARIEQAVASQDKTVERVYTATKKEVSVKNAEIRKVVRNLSPDAIAINLDSLVQEYCRERDAGD